MEPFDTLAPDMADYFSGGWLRWDKTGELVQVLDIATGPSLEVMDKRGHMSRVADLSTLHPAWLRPGSYEGPLGAFYLSRHPYRSKKRTMSVNHYAVMWSSLPMTPQDAIWAAIRDMSSNRTLKQAIGVLKTLHAARVNRDLIVARPECVHYGETNLSNKAVALIVRGEFTAILDGETLLPVYDELGINTKLTRLLLLREGLSC